MTRLLGVDLGERRIGLAIAEEDGSGPAAHHDQAWSPARRRIAALTRIVAEQAVSEIVVGLPLEAAGQEGRQSGITREWVDAVIPALGRPVSYRDERLTSHLAEQRLGPMPRGRSGGPPTAHQRDVYRARVDREAAAIILQDELDARARLGADVVAAETRDTTGGGTRITGSDT